MTTKDQERAAVEKIRKIVEELGENSYVGFAMDGVLELAEENIREDTAYSMKRRAEIAHERAHDAEERNKRQEEALKNYAEITKKDKQTIDRLKLQIHELEETAKANEISEDLVQELYCMAYDKEADAQEKMEKAADQMTDAIREGEDAQKFAESCTACPFWLLDMQTLGKGECYITGHIINTYGQQDEERMDDCPIVHRMEEG